MDALAIDLTVFTIMDETMGRQPLAIFAGHVVDGGFKDDNSHDNVLETFSSVLLEAIPSSNLSFWKLTLTYLSSLFQMTWLYESFFVFF